MNNQMTFEQIEKRIIALRKIVFDEVVGEAATAEIKMLKTHPVWVKKHQEMQDQAIYKHSEKMLRRWQ